MNLKLNRNIRIELYFCPSGNNDHIPSLVADDSVISLVNLPFKRPSCDQSVLLANRRLAGSHESGIRIVSYEFVHEFISRNRNAN